MLIATAIGGTAYALFSAQPITLLRGTGPIVIFTALLYAACQDLGLDFIAVYAWTGIWAGLILIVLAVTNASNLMLFFSRFTDDIFAALVSLIFVIEAVRKVGGGLFNDRLSPQLSPGDAWFAVLLAAGTCVIAFGLRSAVRIGRRPLPGTPLLMEFAPTLAIVAMTALAMTMWTGHVEGPAVPADYATTSTGRPWLVEIMALPQWIKLACVLPATFAATLLFLDQNITSRIINEGDTPMVKGHGYHLDLLLIGLFTLAFSLFGLPWIVAATVHSVNHLKSLSIRRPGQSRRANPGRGGDAGFSPGDPPCHRRFFTGAASGRGNSHGRAAGAVRLHGLYVALGECFFYPDHGNDHPRHDRPWQSWRRPGPAPCAQPLYLSARQLSGHPLGGVVVRPGDLLSLLHRLVRPGPYLHFTLFPPRASRPYGRL